MEELKVRACQNSHKELAANYRACVVVFFSRSIYFHFKESDKEFIEAQFKRKMQEIESAELFRMSKHDEKETSSSSFTSQLVTKIVDNLQISIVDIRVLFQDPDLLLVSVLF